MKAELDGFSFNAETHEYRLNGNVIAGCTSVIKTSGLVPFAFADEDILERKRDLGKEVHKVRHLYDIEELGNYDNRIKPYLHAWIDFREKTNFKPILSEVQTIGFVNGLPFGMQIDCFGELGGADTVVEVKTGEVYPHHGVQLAGYAAGLPHEKLTTPFARFMSRRRVAVQLKPNGRFKLENFDARSDFEMFASALYVSSWKRRYEKTYKF